MKPRSVHVGFLLNETGRRSCPYCAHFEEFGHADSCKWITALAVERKATLLEALQCFSAFDPRGNLVYVPAENARKAITALLKEGGQ